MAVRFMVRLITHRVHFDAVETNCRPTAQIAVFRNVFSEIVPKLKTEKERLVLEAFRHYGLV